MRVRWLGRLVAGAVLVVGASVPLACDTYGEETPTPPAADAAKPDASAPVEDATTPLPDTGGPGPTETGGPTEVCPTCSATCLASGCTGSGAISNDCRAPRDGMKGDRFTLFVCPEGQTVTLPQQCNNGGEVHVGVVRLGAGDWRLHVTGTMPLVATGDCGTITACRGGSSETTMDITGPTVAMIGSFTPVNMCRELIVEVD
jgi:hypothetical protein